MLRYFYENEFIRYVEDDVVDWKEAIKESCRIFLDKKMINDTYVEEIISCVEQHGPYIVIVPDVAMPHSSEESSGVFGTGISFTKFKRPIIFDNGADDEEKSATLFFTLAAKNPEEHMQNIQNLSELLMTDGLIESLVATNSIEDFEQIMKKYNE